MRTLTIVMQRRAAMGTKDSMLSLVRQDVIAAIEARPLTGAHARQRKKLFLSQMTTSNNAKKTKITRQRLGHSSPSGRSIPFGEGLAETGQTRQKLGVACDLTRNNGAAGEMGRALQKTQN